MADSPLLPLRDAIREVLARVPAPRAARIPLASALGFVLSEDICADADAPPFRKAMMDGFAVRAADVADAPVDLLVTQTVPAGKVPEREVRAGEAARVMTGAPVPEGADAVIMVERTEPLQGDRVRILESVPAGRNLAPRGAEVREGDVVLEAGIRIGAADIGVLAAVGRAEVPVFAAPRIGVLSTGDELVPVSETPGPGQIRNSNSPALVARMAADGFAADALGVLPDELGPTRKGVGAALDASDVVVLTGGVSMGDRDLVGEALVAEGFDKVFHKIRLKPGKPVLFGTAGDTLVFGLPGNPVSVAVTYELLVRPALRAFAGVAPLHRPRIFAVLAEGAVRVLPREQYLPARLELELDGASLRAEVSLMNWTASADLFSFARANALLVVPAGGPAPEAGGLAEVLLLEDGVAGGRGDGR